MLKSYPLLRTSFS